MSQLKLQKLLNKQLLLGFKGRPRKSATEESYFPEEDPSARTPAVTVTAVLGALLTMTLTSKAESCFSLLMHTHSLLGHPTPLPPPPPQITTDLPDLFNILPTVHTVLLARKIFQSLNRTL